MTQKSAFDSASWSFRGGTGIKARPFSRGGIPVEVPHLSLCLCDHHTYDRISFPLNPQNLSCRVQPDPEVSVSAAFLSEFIGRESAAN